MTAQSHLYRAPRDPVGPWRVAGCGSWLAWLGWPCSVPPQSHCSGRKHEIETHRLEPVPASLTPLTCWRAPRGLTAGPTATGVFSTQGLLQLPSSLPAHAKAMSVPILMYHYVDDAPPVLGPDAGGLTVRTRAFELQMDFLAKNGYHTVTLEQVYAAMAGLVSLPAKPVALTFDDGGLDDYTVAFPILRSHHFVATFFVITDFVGGSNAMSWDQLRAMQLNGMAIESHTARHADLTKVTATVLRAELTQSRKLFKCSLVAFRSCSRIPLAITTSGSLMLLGLPAI